MPEVFSNDKTVGKRDKQNLLHRPPIIAKFVRKIVLIHIVFAIVTANHFMLHNDTGYQKRALVSQKGATR